MTELKLTAKETALLTAIGEFKFSFFDQGIAAESGIWTDTLTAEAAGPKSNISTSQRGVASVVNSLGKKGLLVTTNHGDEEGAWTALTEEGAAMANKLAGNPVSTEMEEKAPKAKAAKVNNRRTSTKAAAPAAAPASADTMERKAKRLQSLQDRLASATQRRKARGEKTPNITEKTLTRKIEGVKAFIASHEA